jgi:hypothetical protein
MRTLHLVTVLSVYKNPLSLLKIKIEVKISGDMIVYFNHSLFCWHTKVV